MVVFWSFVLVIKAIVLLVVLLVFLPFILLWVWIRGMMYRAALKRELRKAGLPEWFASDVANDMRLRSLLRTVRKIEHG